MNKLIPNVNVPCGEKGDYKIIRKYVNYVNPEFQFSRRYVPAGEYTFLYRDNVLIMSDTPDEKRDHYEVVRRATGKCLIAGLGIGMVLNAIAMKPEVTHIDLVEISQDLIDLVAGYYNNLYPDKITFHCISIFEFIPPKEKYQIAWFDIWDNLCIDNLKDMSNLHRKFGKKTEWQNSWGKEFLQYHKKRQNIY